MSLHEHYSVHRHECVTPFVFWSRQLEMDSAVWVSSPLHLHLLFSFLLLHITPLCSLMRLHASCTLMLSLVDTRIYSGLYNQAVMQRLKRLREAKSHTHAHIHTLSGRERVTEWCIYVCGGGILCFMFGLNQIPLYTHPHTHTHTH